MFRAIATFILYVRVVLTCTINGYVYSSPCFSCKPPQMRYQHRTSSLDFRYTRRSRFHLKIDSNLIPLGATTAFIQEGIPTNMTAEINQNLHTLGRERDRDKHVNLDLNEFESCLQSMSLPIPKQHEIINDVIELGFTSTSELYLLGKDFVHRPEALSSLLRNDFGLNPLKSHLMRGSLMRLVESMHNDKGNESAVSELGANDEFPLSSVNLKSNEPFQQIGSTVNSADPILEEVSLVTRITGKKAEDKKPLFKSVVVNQNAKQRHESTTTQHNYGLPSNYKKNYPKLAKELDEFLHFMITPCASVQESPIRKTTAVVYIRHAKLFLGWYRSRIDMEDGDDSLSIRDAFPNQEASSAQPVIDFILWLRNARQISDSYEANILRGLTKLLKFRYVDESKADPSYGEKSFGDIKAVRELRKLHRDANRRQILSPRSSEEDRKWLDWDEYLNVVQMLKEEVESEIRIWEDRMGFDEASPSNTFGSEKIYTPLQRKIARTFQAYLILSFFACVPDRQRTFRELEIGTTFIRARKIDCWIIKHGPDDYKTGKTYGDRPPLVLAKELTCAIDDFLERWRPCLRPSGQHFFVQSRTGKAFTQDSVYNLVARSCFKFSGKKTNPHLLRDMIVTHVRDSNASEKELEALALYMGHSITMQRNSYDRRTMEQKVAPAVELLRNVNKQNPLQ